MCLHRVLSSVKIPLSFDDEVLLCAPNLMAWWVRLHPVHDGQLRLCGNLVALG